MEPLIHLSCSFLQNKLKAYSQKKTIFANNSTLDIWEVLNNTNSYFDESYSPNINTQLNL